MNNSPKKILIIGLVWPEPDSSAAGWRMMQLIEFFQKQNYIIHFASAASKSEHSYPLEQNGITTKHIHLNHSSFDDYLQEIQPEIVMFDRFVTEEQFGWRVRNILPNAMTILDTEDLHFVRKSREKAYKKNLTVDFFSAEAKREIASIFRCDLSLIISRFEQDLLINDFRIPTSLLLYIPFIQQGKSILENILNFSDRQNFMFIGNCLHEPNYQTILKLKKDIWGKIKMQIPTAELHIYGAYMTEKVWQLHQPKNGFIIQGRAENVLETMNNYRVLLAPIPFGAGIKGKFVDAIRAGLPSVTTSVGAEDMQIGNQWCGFVENQYDSFIEKAIELYNNQQIWERAKNVGFDLYQQYQNADYLEKLSYRIEEISTNLNRNRQQNFIGQILHDNQYNALKYMSKWIEEKNK